MLLDRSPSTYLYIVYDIQRPVHDLLPDVCVKIRYIPGHKNIIGNEMVDRAVKDAHGNMELERVQVAHEEMMNVASIGLHERWQNKWGEYFWKEQASIVGKG